MKDSLSKKKHADTPKARYNYHFLSLLEVMTTDLADLMSRQVIC